jgi:UDP-N-acetylmuramyl tripeptide synthase
MRDGDRGAGTVTGGNRRRAARTLTSTATARMDTPRITVPTVAVARDHRGGTIRRVIAVAAGRLTRWASRHRGSGGTSLPGLVADRIDPGIVRHLADDLPITVLVIGTNGKTTTARLLARILADAGGLTPITNPSGANLAQGIATSLVSAARLRSGGRLPAVPAVLEVDEFAFEAVAADLRPNVVVATNLMRDQLDRYGEIDSIVERWKAAFRFLDFPMTFVYCSDDPRLSTLASAFPGSSTSFGLGGPDPFPQPEPTATEADAVSCHICRAPLDFEWRALAHLGAFACPNGHLARSEPDVLATVTRETNQPTLELTLSGPSWSHHATIELGGPSGAYDAAASVAGAIAAGISPAAAVRGLDGATPAFGRLEVIRIGAKRLVLMLVKNPASFSETQRIAARMRPDVALIALNDGAADGRDVSWIWDADVSSLEDLGSIVIAGTRADDLAVRLKYAPRSDEGIWPIALVTTDLAVGLDRAIDLLPTRGTACLLATYTAMVELRRLLGGRSELDGRLPA